MTPRFGVKRLAAGVALATVFALPALAVPGWYTEEPLAITVVAEDGTAKAIISSGDELGDFVFEGLPDGIGLVPGPRGNTVDVYVAHEQSRVPFRNQADFVDSSVSKVTLHTGNGSVLGAQEVLSPDLGFIRFCSAFMAGPEHGFDNYTFFVNEESNDTLAVPVGAPYGADPSLVPDRQAGFAAMLDTVTGEIRQVDGMGRYNHENSMVIPGGWDDLAILSTDDTFSAGTSQFYMYTAADDEAVWSDEGTMWAFRVTSKNGDDTFDSADPFNGANDYLDMQPGDVMTGEFIEVPEDIAKGDTLVKPQTALENWSNANNVFQFIRLEDIDYDRDNPRIVYVADTGSGRIVPNPTTGRMYRPSGVQGLADNGRIFGFEFNADDPTVVDRMWVVADGDAPASGVYVPFRSPDNLGISPKSLMVQEDTRNARIWRYDLGSGEWSVVATVNDTRGESSGIVDASRWFGGGAWLLTVQQHGTNDDQEQIGDVLYKREDGQLVLMRIPGS